MRHILMNLAFALLWATAHAAGPRPQCQTDAGCAWDKVCEFASDSDARSSGRCVKDQVPPVATLSMLPIYVNSLAHRLTGQVSDNRRVDSARFWLDGRRVATTYPPGSDIAFADISLPRREGAHLVELRVKDVAGNVGMATGTVFLDTQPPQLTLAVPLDGAVLDKSEVLAVVTVSEVSPAEITVGAKSFFHPGAPAPVAYSVLLQLAEGEQLLTVSAKDAAGNASKVSSTVWVDLKGPEVWTDLPGPHVIWGCDSSSREVDLTWIMQVSDVTRTTIFASEGSLPFPASTPRGGAQVDVLTRLRPDKNAIELTVKDELGRETKLWREVIFRLVSCDDRNACTGDSVDRLTGVVSHVSLTQPGHCCDPLDGAQVLIDDGNACTNDACNPATGVVTSTDNFDPGLACCNPDNGATLVIPDNTACTNYTCDPTTGTVTPLETTPAGSDCVYHVAVDGSDTGTGSEQDPWRTIAKALEVVRPGDVIRLGEGDFVESVLVDVSGEEGAPIVIEGTRGDNNELLSRILGSVEVEPTTWQEAPPEVGADVYYNATVTLDPGQLTVDGDFVPRVHSSKTDTWLWSILNYAHDELVPLIQDADLYVPFWEAVHGVYGYDSGPGLLYLRLADGRDPRDSSVVIRISRRGAVVTIEDAAHITLRGLIVEGGELGVEIAGPDSQQVIVEDCQVIHGRRRIQISDASHVTVRNNVIEMRALTAEPGAWMGGALEVHHLREFVYEYFKYINGPGETSDDRAIMMEGASHVVIEGNEVIAGLIGLETVASSNVEILNNKFRNLSSVGLALRPGSLDVHFHDNAVENANVGVRTQYLTHILGHRAYIYRNRFQIGEEAGSHGYLHADLDSSDANTDPEIFFYHNTFIGGSRCFTAPNPADLYSNWLRKVVIVNNLLSTFRPWIGAHEHVETFIGAFDHNWVGGLLRNSNDPQHDYFPYPLWFGTNNVIPARTCGPVGAPVACYVAAEVAWDVTAGADLPEGVLESGLDLSHPFTGNDGQQFLQLPGMNTGYFQGVAPDVGAVQFNRPL